MKKITIVILHFASVAITQDCIKSVCKMQRVTDFEVDIIIVDNAAAESFPQKTIQCSLGKIIIFRNKKNLGYTGGMNTGIRYAFSCGADYIMVLNNDTELDKHMLQELVTSLERDEKVVGVVPKIYFYPGTEFHKDRYEKKDLGKVFWYAGGDTDWKNVYGFHRGVDEIDHRQYDLEEPVGFATGCCLLLRSSMLKKIGLFDEKYFLYYEDNDLSQRFKKAGYKILYTPKAKLWHKNAKSVGGSGSVLQDYYISRNRLLFGMRYAPLRAKLSLLREGLTLLRNGRPWQKKGVRDFFLGRFGKGSYSI